MTNPYGKDCTLADIRTKHSRHIEVFTENTGSTRIYLKVKSTEDDEFGDTSDYIQSVLNKQEALELAAGIIKHYNRGK